MTRFRRPELLGLLLAILMFAGAVSMGHRHASGQTCVHCALLRGERRRVSDLALDATVRVQRERHFQAMAGVRRLVRREATAHLHSPFPVVRTAAPRPTVGYRDAIRSAPPRASLGRAPPLC